MSSPEERDAIWRRIEADARAQVADELTVLAETPLVYGDHIAWTTTAYKGVTDGVSPVHRVGSPIGMTPHTTCGEAIPLPALWFPLNQRLVERMPSCRFCEAEYKRLTQGIAA